MCSIGYFNTNIYYSMRVYMFPSFFFLSTDISLGSIVCSTSRTSYRIFRACCESLALYFSVASDYLSSSDEIEKNTRLCMFLDSSNRKLERKTSERERERKKENLVLCVILLNGCQFQMMNSRC